MAVNAVHLTANRLYTNTVRGLYGFKKRILKNPASTDFVFERFMCTIKKQLTKKAHKKQTLLNNIQVSNTQTSIVYSFIV